MDCIPASDPVDAEQDEAGSCTSQAQYWRNATVFRGKQATREIVDAAGAASPSPAALILQAALEDAGRAIDVEIDQHQPEEDSPNKSTKADAAVTAIDGLHETRDDNLDNIMDEEQPSESQIRPSSMNLEVATVILPSPSVESDRSSPPITPASSQMAQAAPIVEFSPEVPQDGDFAKTRSLRQRTAKQLNPYSIEQARYITALNQRDWQDAVVKIKSRELTADELAQRAEQARMRGADDLDGWLLLEDGTRVRRLPGYERDAVENEYVQPEERQRTIIGRKRKRRTEHQERDRALRIALGATVSSSDESVSIPLPQSKHPRKRQRRLSQPNSGSPNSTDGVLRASSEPPSQSPDQNKTRRKLIKVARNSKENKTSRDSAVAIDLNSDSSEDRSGSDRLESIQQTISASRANKKRGKRKSNNQSSNNGKPANDKSASQIIDIDASDDSRQSGSGSDSDPVIDKNAARIDRFTLNQKKRKHLKGMMPSVFMKRAEADLKLMKRERAQGKRHSELYERGSGDEDNNSDSDQARDNAAIVRKRLVGPTGPLRLNGDSESSASDDHPDVHQDNELSNWLGIRNRATAFRDDVDERPKARSKTSDVIDRLLKQSTRKSKSRGKSSKNEKASRRPLEEVSNLELPDITEARPQKRKGNRERTAKRPRGIDLNDDDVLFGRADTLDSGERRQFPESLSNLSPQRLDRLELPVAHAVPFQPASGKPEDKRWSDFRSFSFDFGIPKLPTTLTFHRTSYIGSGQLHTFLESLQSADNSQRNVVVFPFGFQLDSSMEADSFVDLLPRLCDNIMDQAITPLSQGLFDEAQRLKAVESSLAVYRFAGTFYARHQAVDLSRSIQLQIDHLERRITCVQSVDAAKLAFLGLKCQLAWAAFDFSMRLYSKEGDNEHLKSPEIAFKQVVSSLMDYGINNTGKSVKRLSEQCRDGPQTCDDPSIEVWACVVVLCTMQEPCSIGRTNFDENYFWEFVENHLQQSKDVHPVKAAETGAYTAMLLSAISQISSSGVVTLRNALQGHWPIVCRAIAPINTEQSTENVVQTKAEVTLRDGYIWTLCARCLVIATRFGWRLDGREGIVPKIYDILNLRTLANLSIDGSRDFPDFIQNFRGEIVTELDPRADSTFHIFLKLLAKAIQDMPGEDQAEKTRNINKLLARVTPIRKMPFTIQAAVLDRDRSMLVNHLSLFIVLSVLLPSTAGQRFNQMRSMLSFEEADSHSRPLLIRAVLYSAQISKQLGLSLNGPLGWFANAANLLRAQYTEIERKRMEMANDAAKPVAKGMSAVVNTADRLKQEKQMSEALFNIALLLTMILRAVQNVMKTGVAEEGKVEFPDLTLLNNSWTRDILSSPVAQDPFIGIEVLNFLQCFLNLRARATATPIVEASQDEYGLGDFDFDDPALNAMIGYAPVNQEISNTSQTQDAKLANLIKTGISPSIYKLICGIYTPQITRRGAPVIADNVELKQKYVDALVQCWVSCASVLVSNQAKDWGSYLSYGDEAINRIADPLGRSDVATLFARHLTLIDRPAFVNNINEFIPIWFRSIVSCRPMYQHNFTNGLFGVLDSTHAVFHNLRTLRVDGELVTLSEADFVNKRVTILDDIFGNMRKIIAGQLPDVAIIPSRSVMLAWVNDMLSAMRDNLESLPAQSQSRSSYEIFCRKIVDSIKTTGAPYLNERTLSNLRLVAGIGQQV